MSEASFGKKNIFSKNNIYSNVKQFEMSAKKYSKNVFSYSLKNVN